MPTFGAMALTAADVAFFTPPPRRPNRPGRRSDRRRAVARLIRAARRELARATDDSAAAWIPDVSRRYPR